MFFMANHKLLDKINNNVLSKAITGNIIVFNDDSGTVSKDSGINALNLEQVMANNNAVLTHLVNQNIHLNS